MARAGINYVDVANAAKQVQLNGAEPTVDRVRSELGTGSKSTIAPLLKRWKESAGNVQAVEGIPKALADSVQALYQQAVTAAQASFEEERASLTAQLEETRTQLRTCQSDLSAVKSDCAALASERDKLNSKLEHEQGENAALNADAIKLETQLGAKDEKLAENQIAIEDLKAENKAIREHFEHFQAHISEERQSERDQYAQTLNIERQRNIAVTEELGSMRKKLSTIESLAQNQHSTIVSHESKIKELGDDFAQADIDRKELQSKLEKISIELVDLENDCRGLTGQLDVAEKENYMLVKHNTTLVAQAESATARQEKLNDQLHLVTQEKSVIQGQFMQLQSSL